MSRHAWLALVGLLGLLNAISPNLVQAQPKQPPKYPWPPSEHVAPTEPLSPADELKAMSVPPGFEIQLVASEPDIMKPINIAFDAKGRLWVTTSREYPYPNYGAKTGDSVKILEDFGPDGKARKITTFAENLNIPIGVLPVGKGAIVYSIPNVWYMEDTTGNGKADVKKVLLSGYGHADTHGMTGEFQQGFDGWIYACHGFSNTSKVKGTDGSEITMQSGNTYRFKPDGSKVEHFTHGQVNPFGLSFDSLGNLYSCDCHTQPIYQLLRGAWYPSFAKPHDGLGFGPEMMTHSHGSTAIAGITYYAAEHFPKDFHDNIFIGNVVTNRINRDKLKQFGSTYKAIEQPDFLISKDPWFRPVDIRLGPDGALYVADFYTRIIGHYELPLNHPGRTNKHGRIWRIIYKGQFGSIGKLLHPVKDFTKASVKELVEDLGHPNLTVRLFATDQLVERGGKEVIESTINRLKNSNAFVRIHGLWVLERLKVLTNVQLAQAAADPVRDVRVHALKILGARAKWTSAQHKQALDSLKDEDAFVQRAAVQAVGNHPEFGNVAKLLALRAAVPPEDTHLFHAVRIAIRDHLKEEKILAGYSQIQLKDADILALADVLPSIPTAGAAEFLSINLKSLVNDKGRFPTYVKHIARFGEGAAQANLISFGRKHHADNSTPQAVMLKSYYQGLQERGAGLDAEALKWAEEVTRTLIDSKISGECATGSDLAGLLKLQSAQPALLAVLQDRSRPEALRGQAALSLAKINPQQSIAPLAKILSDSTQPMALRQVAAKGLVDNNLAEGRAELIKALPLAQAQLQTAIAINLAGSKQGGEQLLDAVAKGKASPQLLRDKLVEQSLQKAGIPGLKEKLAKLTKGLPPADVQLLNLIKQRAAGFAKAKSDAKIGAMVFQKNCANCHSINNQGSKLAPQLDGVGIRGVDRLLEDILDPNRNVDQEFRATTLVLKNGKIVSGQFIKQEGEILIIADNQGKEQRYDKKDVDDKFVSQMSPMPANWGEQISETDLYHLLAYLLEQHAAIEKPAGK